MDITLETILAVVIVLITLNLLVVGIYIVRVLKEALRTIRMAQVVIDDVDESIKDGVEKMKAMEKPLQAMAMTSGAVTGILKSAGGMIRKNITGNSKATTILETKAVAGKKKKSRRKFFKKK